MVLVAAPLPFGSVHGFAVSAIEVSVLALAGLYLAFEGLGAQKATSGAIEGNPQSLGVSRKLGYEVVGSHLVSPRGVPVEHTDLELQRESFRSPVPVELVALEPLLPLFGAA